MNQKIDLDPAIQPGVATTEPRQIFYRIMRFALPLAIILIGAVLGWSLMISTPKAERVVRERQPRLVETVTLHSASVPVSLIAWGEVTPSREVVVKAQVSGVVEAMLHALEPGSFVGAGAPLLQLERAEYEAALSQRRAELDQARANLAIEQGSQAVARTEFTLLGEDAGAADSKLMLREPQLLAASAQVKFAEAALATAQLNVQRTLIRAPFDGVIKLRHADLGSHVTVNGDVITITGTDHAWVEVSVPLNQLQWIRFPDETGQPGSSVTLVYDQVWADGLQRSGTVVRLLSDLESTGRMARVLVQVDDPLALQAASAGQPPLLMGSFIRAQVQGKMLDDVIVIPSAMLREGDTVWIHENDQLRVRPVDVIYRNQENAYVRSGVAAGEQLVTSMLNTVTDGMPLRTRTEQGESTP